jgi:hypothetical protein
VGLPVTGKWRLTCASPRPVYSQAAKQRIVRAVTVIRRRHHTGFEPLFSVRRHHEPVLQLSVVMWEAYTAGMEIREGRQSNPVVDEVGALVAVTRPVIAGVLQSISEEVVNTVAERGRLPLRMLGRLRKLGDGDCGIAFEYAVHDAVISAEPVVVERVADALNKCRIVRGNPASILFAIDKTGAQQLISTEVGLITENSRVLSGQPGQPVKLKKHLNALAAAFRAAPVPPAGPARRRLSAGE